MIKQKEKDALKITEEIVMEPEEKELKAEVKKGK